MQFIWNDGGRALSGFVGSTGDCVTRAIAIATGRAYRDVYQELGVRTQKSPRDGVPTRSAADYLNSLGWRQHSPELMRFCLPLLPKGIVIVAGCCHPRMANIKAAAAEFGNGYGIIGGLHGNGPESLKDFDLICATHCSQYRDEIMERWPGRYVEGGAGRIIDIG